MLLESYRFIDTSKVFKDASKYFSAEPLKTGGQHLQTIISAIRKRIKIEFKYRKYSPDVESSRRVDPFFFKDFKGRWYLIGRDNADRKIKIFALERIIGHVYHDSPEANYDLPINLNPDTYFKDCFGIMRFDDGEAEEIEISVTPLIGKFIKSQPMHVSQQIVTDNAEELRIKLKVQITEDFIRDLLSYGSKLRVIAPEGLRLKLIEEYRMALELNK